MKRKKTEDAGRDTVVAMNNFPNLVNSEMLGDGWCFDSDGNISDIQDARRDPARTSWVDADIDFLGISIHEMVPEEKHDNRKGELSRLIEEQAMDLALDMA